MGIEPPKKWLVLFIVAMNGFLIILDFSSVNLSFPTLTAVFGTDISVVLWVSAAFTLISAGLTPIFGKLADQFGHKRIFILGYAVFTVGLILCSLAQNISQLIVFRSIQGIGAAMNMALSFAIATDAFPVHQRGRALGMLTSVFSIGPLVGFSLAGVILDLMSWQALFYTRVPLCLLGIFMASKYLQTDSIVKNMPSLDLLGAGLLFSSLVCLIVSLNVAGRHGIDTPHVLLLGGVGSLLFLLFLLQELKNKQPIVDLGLYRSAPFRGASISLAVVGTVQSGQILLLPFLLQRGFAYTAVEAGLILAVLPLLHFTVAPVSGILSDKFGTKTMSLAGMGFLLVGLFLMTRLSAKSDVSDIIVSFVFTGIGGGLFHAPNTSQIMGSVTERQLGSAGALASTTRQIAMACSIVVSEMIFSARQTVHLAHSSNTALWDVPLERVALIKGFNDTMMLAGIFCLLGIFVLMRSRSR